MAAGTYTITLELSTKPTDGDNFDIEVSAVELWRIVWKDIPTLSHECQIYASPLYSNMNSFAVTFGYKYNSGQTYTVTHYNGGLSIDITGYFLETPTDVSVGNGGLSISIVQVTSPLSIITRTPVTADSNQCEKIDLDIITNREVVKLVLPYEDLTFTGTTNTAKDLDRGTIVQILVEDSVGGQAARTVQLPSRLSTTLLQTQVVSGSVTVTDSTTGLTLTYSLNNITFVSSNVFSGLTAGTHQYWVKDQYGCTVQSSFTIAQGADDVIYEPVPYFFYSKANPIRMALRETWDDVDVLKNDQNILSCEGYDDLNYKEIQKWRSTDVVTLQVRNNYSDLEIRTTNDAVAQTLLQKSSNLGVEIALDCKTVDLGAGRLGIYFLAGATYDYTTLTDLNEDYDYNGVLPSWVKVGRIITISSVNYEIAEISFNEDLEVEQFEILGNFIATNQILKSTYNIYEYEVYETSIAVNGRGDFQVEIYYDGAVQYISEYQKVDDVSILGKLIYYMSYNTDMFFASGIEPFVRLEIDSIKAEINNDSELYETDITVDQVDSNNYEVDVVKFFPMTKAMFRKTVLALSMDNINLNGIDYTKTSLEGESLGSSTNIYTLSATLTIKGTGLAKENSGVGLTEITELIQLDTNGYIKI